MNLSEFTPLALRTESRIDTVKVNRAELINVLTTFVAIGNLLDIIKKETFYNKQYPAIQRESLISTALASIIELAAPSSAAEQVDLVDIDPRIFHGIVGIATEGTELIETLVKSVRSGGTVDRTNIGEEIGDVCWYVAILLDSLSLDGDVILEAVIAKLRKRYPERFTSDAAINRDIDGERRLLESSIANT